MNNLVLIVFTIIVGCHTAIARLNHPVYIPCDIPLPKNRKFHEYCHSDSSLFCDYHLSLVNSSKMAIINDIKQFSQKLSDSVGISIVILRSLGLPEYRRPLESFLNENFNHLKEPKIFRICERIAHSLHNSSGISLSSAFYRPQKRWSKDQVDRYIELFHTVLRKRWFPYTADACERHISILIITDWILQSDGKILSSQPTIDISFGSFFLTAFSEQQREKIQKILPSNHIRPTISEVLSLVNEGLHQFIEAQRSQVQHSIPFWAKCAYAGCVGALIIIGFLNWFVVTRFNLVLKKKSTGLVKKTKARVLMISSFAKKT